jgi:hypothetical protein
MTYLIIYKINAILYMISVKIRNVMKCLEISRVMIANMMLKNANIAKSILKKIKKKSINFYIVKNLK